MALPDVVNDHCVQAARNMGCQFMETFFFRAALEAGFREEPHHRDAEDKAQELMKIWARKGFLALPQWVRNFAVLKAQNLTAKPQGLIGTNVFSNKPIMKKGA